AGAGSARNRPLLRREPGSARDGGGGGTTPTRPGRSPAHSGGEAAGELRLSLSLLVDEDTQARELVARLRAAGHEVLTAGEANLNAQDDAAVLARARPEGDHRAAADH